MITSEQRRHHSCGRGRDRDFVDARQSCRDELVDEVVELAASGDYWLIRGPREQHCQVRRGNAFERLPTKEHRVDAEVVAVLWRREGCDKLAGVEPTRPER